MNTILPLLDQYEVNDNEIIEALADQNNMEAFINLFLNWADAPDKKYPFIISELIYLSYDRLLSLFFSTTLSDDHLPLQRILAFLDMPQNETSCGYFEKILKPFIVLKSAETKPLLPEATRFLKLIQFEGIQNILIAILQSNHLESDYKLTVFEALSSQFSDEVCRIMLQDTQNLQTWVGQRREKVQQVFEMDLNINTLLLIEQLMRWDIYDVQWLRRAIKLLAVEKPLTQILQEEKTMNFLHSVPRLGEVKLQLIKILTLTKEMEETVEFEKILLTLLLKHEWNNQLQNIAVSYYRDLSYHENPHSQYFRAIIKEFIADHIAFQKEKFDLQIPVSRGYQWVFTAVIRIFELDRSEPVKNIINLEDNFLLGYDPQNQKGRSSFSISDKINERMISWIKRDQQKEEEPEVEIEPGFKSRNSFGCHLDVGEGIEEELASEDQSQILSGGQNSQPEPGGQPEQGSSGFQASQENQNDQDQFQDEPEGQKMEEEHVFQPGPGEGAQKVPQKLQQLQNAEEPCQDQEADQQEEDLPRGRSKCIQANK